MSAVKRKGSENITKEKSPRHQKHQKHPLYSGFILFREVGSGFRLQRKAGSRKFMSFKGSKWSHGGPWTLAMEAWRLKRWSYGRDVGQC
jgi:hypothetical protein